MDRVQSILNLFGLGLSPEPALPPPPKKKKIKQPIWEEWNKWMINPTAQNLTPTRRFRGPTSTQICLWVDDNAWGGIKKIVI